MTCATCKGTGRVEPLVACPVCVAGMVFARDIKRIEAEAQRDVAVAVLAAIMDAAPTGCVFSNGMTMALLSAKTFLATLPQKEEP